MAEGVSYEGIDFVTPPAHTSFPRTWPAHATMNPVYYQEVRVPPTNSPKLDITGNPDLRSEAWSYNKELELLQERLIQEHVPYEQRISMVARKMVEYIVYGGRNADYDRPSAMARRYAASKSSLESYIQVEGGYTPEQKPMAQEETQEHLKQALLDHYQRIESQVQPIDGSAPYIEIQSWGPSYIDSIGEGNIFHKIYLDQATATRTLAWNKFIQEELRAGNLDTIFDQSDQNRLRLAARLADGHLLDMGSFMMVEVGQIQSRLVGGIYDEQSLQKRWDLSKGFNPWLTQCVTTHIKDSGLIELAQKVGSDVVPLYDRLNADSYRSSYRNLIALMEHPYNKGREPYVDFSEVFSYETWIYDPDLIVHFPEQGVSELASIAGEVVTLGDASPQQIEFATKNSSKRSEAYQKGEWTPKVVARRISLEEMKKIVGLSKDELQERIALFRQSQLQGRSEFGS